MRSVVKLLLKATAYVTVLALAILATSYLRVIGI